MGAREIFQAVFDAYVERYLAADAAGAASFYAQDAAIFSPFGPPVHGRDTLTKLHLEWFEEGEINKKIEVIDATAESSIGFCTAQYSADIPQEDGSVLLDSGTSLNTFEKQTDGTWKIKHTSLNTLETEE